MRKTGGTAAGIKPHTTVSGVDRSVASGLLSMGAGCAAAAPANDRITKARIHLVDDWDMSTLRARGAAIMA
jgi:hypothetical protein